MIESWLSVMPRLGPWYLARKTRERSIRCLADPTLPVLIAYVLTRPHPRIPPVRS